MSATIATASTEKVNAFIDMKMMAGAIQLNSVNMTNRGASLESMDGRTTRTMAGPIIVVGIAIRT